MNKLNRSVNSSLMVAIWGAATVDGEPVGFAGMGEDVARRQHRREQAERRDRAECCVESKNFRLRTQFHAVEAFSNLPLGDACFGSQGGEGDQLVGTAEFEGGVGEDVFEVAAFSGELVGGDGCLLYTSRCV